MTSLNFLSFKFLLYGIFSVIILQEPSVFAENKFKNLLFLEILPMITDHRGDKQLFVAAKENFLSEWLPYSDTYLPFIGTIEQPIDQKWIVEQDGLKHIIVNLNSWSDLPIEVKNYAIYQHYLRLSGFTSYKVRPLVWADSIKDFQEKNFVLYNTQTVNAKWFEKWSSVVNNHIDTNCFSLALKTQGFNVVQNINPNDFESILKKNFFKVTKPQTGDLIVLEQEDGYTIHAAVFFGYSAKNLRKKIFLSKNGHGMGIPLFIDEYTMLNKNYPEATNSNYWRVRSSTR